MNREVEKTLAARAVELGRTDSASAAPKPAPDTTQPSSQRKTEPRRQESAKLPEHSPEDPNT